MEEKLNQIENRYLELEQMMADPSVAADYQRVTKLAREQSELREVVEVYRRFKRVKDELNDAQELLETSDDADMKELAEAEIEELVAENEELTEQLRLLLVPKDPRDQKNVIVEIRAGTGGDEAGLFAADLSRMITRYAEQRRWKTQILSSSLSGIGGFKEVIFEVRGEGAYSRLKYESGVHRVQRVPDTESQGRIHTSTATVAVLPEVEDVEIDIDPNDIRMDIYRSSGPGGQSVNTTDSAVRLTYLPTGLVVQCQDEKSQLQNRLRAMTILRARLYDAEVERQQAELGAERRSQVGTGERSVKIRTYNYPQNRVTDHRIGISSYNLLGVMDGKLDAFIDELATAEQVEKLQALGSEV
ncbi:MAG: peptide chain release factor 1 [Chloroflexi bacterium]|nr:peptide chain release factor 1 [Chloroflexota bacterium]